MCVTAKREGGAWEETAYYSVIYQAIRDIFCEVVIYFRETHM